jgi:hypothetical protein
MFPRIVALLLLGAAVCHAASPHLATIDPPGLQRGADTDVTISGERLGDSRGMLFYNPGIAVISLKALDDKRVAATLRAAPDCPLGEHDVRVPECRLLGIESHHRPRAGGSAQCDRFRNDS